MKTIYYALNYSFEKNYVFKKITFTAYVGYEAWRDYNAVGLYPTIHDAIMDNIGSCDIVNNHVTITTTHHHCRQVARIIYVNGKAKALMPFIASVIQI